MNRAALPWPHPTLPCPGWPPPRPALPRPTPACLPRPPRPAPTPPNPGDGTNDNFSWNCGVEGATDNGAVLALRGRQMRNLHLALMLSQGTPMVLAGARAGRGGAGGRGLACTPCCLAVLCGMIAMRWEGLEMNSSNSSCREPRGRAAALGSCDGYSGRALAGWLWRARQGAPCPALPCPALPRLLPSATPGKARAPGPIPGHSCSVLLQLGARARPCCPTLTALPFTAPLRPLACRRRVRCDQARQQQLVRPRLPAHALPLGRAGGGKRGRLVQVGPAPSGGCGGPAAGEGAGRRQRATQQPRAAPRHSLVSLVSGHPHSKASPPRVCCQREAKSGPLPHKRKPPLSPLPHTQHAHTCTHADTILPILPLPFPPAPPPLPGSTLG